MFNRWVAALLGSLLIYGGALAADIWQPYHNSEFGVSTALPGSPAIAVFDTPETAEIYGSHVVRLAVDPDTMHGYSLMMGRMTHPPDDLAAAMDRMVPALAAAMSLPVISQERSEVFGLPTLDAVLGPDRGGLYYRIRVFFRGADTIQLIATRQGSPPPVDEFFTAFRLEP